MTITVQQLLNLQDIIVATQLLLSGKLDKPLAELRAGADAAAQARLGEIEAATKKSIADIAAAQTKLDDARKAHEDATTTHAAAVDKHKKAAAQLATETAVLADAKAAHAQKVATADAELSVRAASVQEAETRSAALVAANSEEARQLRTLREDLEAKLVQLKAIAG